MGSWRSSEDIPGQRYGTTHSLFLFFLANGREFLSHTPRSLQQHGDTNRFVQAFHHSNLRARVSGRKEFRGAGNCRSVFDLSRYPSLRFLLRPFQERSRAPSIASKRLPSSSTSPRPTASSPLMTRASAILLRSTERSARTSAMKRSKLALTSCPA